MVEFEPFWGRREDFERGKRAKAKNPEIRKTDCILSIVQTVCFRFDMKNTNLMIAISDL